MTISNYEYWKECQRLAQDLIDEVRTENPTFEKSDLIDEIQERSWELVDGHQWIIYYSYNLNVIDHSDNENYMIDNNGEDYACEVLKNSGLNGLHSTIAYWAMYADIADCVWELIEQLDVA